MATLTMHVEGPLATVTMDDGENQIGTEALDRWSDVLDEIEEAGALGAMVVTGSGKYWSTGLDLDEVTALDEVHRIGFMQRVDRLLGRLLTLPIITVAALNGHTYAAGALLALAHDYRVMRDDRGYFCLPSVDVGIPFTPGMSALIAAKLPQPIAHDLVVSCRPIGGSEAAATGVVNRAVGSDALMAAATHIASTHTGKDRHTLGTVKRRMYPEVAEMLTTDR
jgi:enoyl-CoA hydratase/carnithine racemase